MLGGPPTTDTSSGYPTNNGNSTGAISSQLTDNGDMIIQHEKEKMVRLINQKIWKDDVASELLSG